MSNKHYIDLSDIKEEELDKTASFTDIMSRYEKMERRKKQKQEETKELKEILMNDDEPKRKKEKKKSAIEKVKDDIDTKEEKINQSTSQLLNLKDDITDTLLNNIDENLDDNKSKKKGFGNIIFIDFLIIISLFYYIYSILFTNIQTNQLYLLIGGCFILAMIIIFCISIISNKILYHLFSILNYLIFIGFLFFNLTLVLNIVKI